ncbi:MAG: sulfite exporter TauE/SafE family protein [Phycisphaerae bacterium]|nr:sulfite exporter TauE/SafE family protein [Phycisphaerae bacterium]
MNVDPTLELAIEAACALGIGLALGLLGAGGSILTVPMLVYVVGEPPKLAIAESLAIVGLIACAAVVRYATQRMVDWRMVLLVGGPGVIGAFGGALIADQMSARVQMLLFAAVVLAAAGKMLAPRDATVTADAARKSVPRAMLAGLGVGVLTGTVGVGGGFLLVPTLVLILGMPITRAIPTSLAIIVANSAVGFARHASTCTPDGIGELHWRLIILFAVVGMAGSVSGALFAKFVPQRALRLAFALLLLAVGLAVGGWETWVSLTDTETFAISNSGSVQITVTMAAP